MYLRAVENVLGKALLDFICNLFYIQNKELRISALDRDFKFASFVAESVSNYSRKGQYVKL